jgi:hypothetical protein
MAKAKTEFEIQNYLYRYLGRRLTIFPNIDVITGYEADIIAVSRAGYAYEYEIKTSLSDFRADLKKLAKHATLSGKVIRTGNPYSFDRSDIYIPESLADTKYKWHYRCYPDLRPKQFWYVISGFELTEKDVPEYAGLIDLSDGYKRIKQAPNLESKKVGQERINHAINNMLYRYWNMRISLPQGEGN